MGRELKRVPMDFDHPIGELWPGYLTEPSRSCPRKGNDCHNGSTAARAYVEALARLLLHVGSDSTSVSVHPVHPWLAKIPLSPGGAKPQADGFAFSTGLAGREPSMSIHDAIDSWKATDAVISAAGLDPKKWGICTTCEGHACHPDDIDKDEDWEATDPPTGVGYQMWNTTTEGHPETPVFATLRELAEHCAEHCTTFASNRASAEGWEQMLGDGLVTTVIAPGVIAL